MSTETPTPWSSRDRIHLVLLWIVFAALVQRFWFITDDAYISFRYSHNLAIGEGLRFNLGEHVPVEGYSNLLWVVLAGAMTWLGLSLESWPLLLSALCGGLLLTLLYRTLRSRLHIGPVPALLAGLSFAAFPPVAVWSSSGLATMPFALLLFATFERLVLRRGSIHGLSAGLAALGLALIRVEGAYWVIALLLIAIVARRFAGERIGPALALATGIFAAGFAAQAIWRNAYYGSWLANTVSAKGGMSLARLGRGVDYVSGWTLTLVVPLLLLPAGLVALRRPQRAILWPALAMALGGPAYAVLVSGDYMAFGRFLVPFWAFNVLLLGVMWEEFGSRTRPRTMVAAALACVAIGALPGWNVHLTPRALRERFHFRHNTPHHATEYEQWVQQKQNGQLWASRGRALRRWLEPGSSIVLDTGIGAIAYYSQLFIYDRGGLVTRETAVRPRLSERLMSPGHDVTKPAKYFLKDRPETMYLKLAPRAGVPNQLARNLEKLERIGAQASEHYVADFRPIPDWEAPPAGSYLVYSRRLEQGQSVAQERLDVDRRAQELVEGIDPYRDQVMEGYPLPPWYGPDAVTR